MASRRRLLRTASLSLLAVACLLAPATGAALAADASIPGPSLAPTPPGTPEPGTDGSGAASGPGATATPEPADGGDRSLPPEPTDRPEPTAPPPATPGSSPGPATPAPTLAPSPTAPPPVPSPVGSAAPTASTPPLTPTPPPTPVPSAPATLDLYRSDGFRYQDPNYVACTATSAQDMLNFIALARGGGPGFLWHATTSGLMRDGILRWARAHDTVSVRAAGSDPHGWRNALNRFGWGDDSLRSRVYEDKAYTTLMSAVRAAVRQMALTRRPVGMAGWSGHHAQMLTGYFGLRGDPFAMDASGRWRDDFTVGGVYLSDPLRSTGLRHARVGLASLAGGPPGVRFTRYTQTDSPYDDPYTPGVRASRLEWYGRYVLLLPIR